MNTTTCLNENMLTLTNETGSISIAAADVEAIIREMRTLTEYRRDVEKFIRRTMKFDHDCDKILADTALMDDIIKAYVEDRKFQENMPSDEYEDKNETVDGIMMDDDFAARLDAYAVQDKVFVYDITLSLYEDGEEIEKSNRMLVAHEKLSEDAVRELFNTANEICSQDYLKVGNDELVEKYRAEGRDDIADNIEAYLTTYLRYDADGFETSVIANAISFYLDCDCIPKNLSQMVSNTYAEDAMTKMGHIDITISR